VVYFSRSWGNKKPCLLRGKQGWKIQDPMITLPAYQKPIRVKPGLMFSQTT
jgi:hypothetical protein